jgi:hypothetical protein
MQPSLIRILHAKALGARDADAADSIGSKRRHALPNPISNGLWRAREGATARRGTGENHAPAAIGAAWAR